MAAMKKHRDKEQRETLLLNSNNLEAMDLRIDGIPMRTIRRLENGMPATTRAS